MVHGGENGFKNPFFCFLSEIPVEGDTIGSADRAYFLRTQPASRLSLLGGGFAVTPYGAEVHSR